MRFLTTVTVFLVVFATPVRADEEKVPLDKVPKAVLEVVKKRFPKAEVVGTSKETDKDKTVYEVELKQDGKTIDVTLTPEGVITTIEQQIDAKDLPKPVAEALDKKYPKATYKIIEIVYAVKDGKEALDFYEVDLVTADKKEFEVKIAADGTVKEVEEKKAEKKEEKNPGLCGDGEKGKKGEKEDEDVDLPKAVAGAVKNKFPGGKVVAASKEGKGEKAVYEVELRFKAATLEVLLTSKGEIVEVEVKGKKQEDEDDKNEKGNKKENNGQRGFQGEQKGQHEDKNDKKGEEKKGKKKEDEKNEKGNKKGEKETRK